jgi:diadenosine tetraphosphate (Ap4A) HIT family hydrolase
VCEKHRQGDAAIGGVIHRDDLVYAGHVYPAPGTDVVYLGHLMAEPTRHVVGLGALTDDEAAALGRLVNDLAAALLATEGAEHVYSFVLGDDVEHLHVHVVARYPGTPTEYWGGRLHRWPDAPRGAAADITAVNDRVRGALARRRQQ